MHNPQSILENETHKILHDFVIQMEHPISARRPDLEIVNTKEWTRWKVFSVGPADYRAKLKKGEKKDKYQDISREIEKKLET